MSSRRIQAMARLIDEIEGMAKQIPCDESDNDGCPIIEAIKVYRARFQGQGAPTEAGEHHLTGDIVADMSEAVRLWKEYQRRDGVRPGSSYSLEPLYMAEDLYRRVLSAQRGEGGEKKPTPEAEAGGAQDGEADLVALVHAYGESIRDFHTDPKGLRGSCAGNVMKAEADLIAALGRLRSLPLSEAMAPAGDLRKLLREARDNAIASLAETGISDERREYRAGLAKRLDAALVALPLSEGPKAAIICSECGQGPLHAMACSHSYVNKPVAPHQGQEGAGA